MNTDTRYTRCIAETIADKSCNGLQRKLDNRQIQLVAVGTSIGTVLFVNIGHALEKAGPGSLLLAFIIQSTMLSTVNNCMAEMATYMPITGGFVRMAGKWVDDAFGFMAGWNFFFYQSIIVPFEITALSIVLSFWTDKIPPPAVCGVCIALYIFLNAMAVGVYGEAEFWLSMGKIILILMMFSFTFITMLGGNPQGDAYGFRYWVYPGAFAEYITAGTSGKFQGFLAALWAAALACVGPEFISMIAAEAKHPRVYLNRAFKTVYWRFCVFYVGSALACGIVVAYNDIELVASSSGQSSAASPYIIAMGNLGIGVLPHFVNALLITSIFSSGNGCAYYATRCLYGLALEGRAPQILRKCTKNGVPIYCLAVVMAFPFLSFLQLSNDSAMVLSWLTSLGTAAIIINYVVICTTYICFHRACMVQGVDRSKLPYTGWFQPWCAYIGLTWMTTVVLFYGYTSFEPWNLRSFFLHYTLPILSPILYVVWKLIHKTTFVRPEDVDLNWDSLQITAYEEALSATESPINFWREIFQLFSLGECKCNRNRS
ncbi:amino acid permease/ SLC12A domain-containing protein [Aspergillus ambiguus]|uniref:amino acid permease/ SLC12A domain-containing protein n=1 Tax=Aspergillus ambiguus TaxID=176160 RepID=UPI003CCD32D2